MNEAVRLAAYEAIDTERHRQDQKFGSKAHYENSNEKWFCILSEEMGELAEALLKGNAEQSSKELIEVAAVAVSWLETVCSGANDMRAGWAPERTAAEAEQAAQ